MTGHGTRTSPVVVTPLGAVRGVARDGSEAFLGIPFAEAPVGPLRFAAPTPVSPWAGVRDASHHGPTPQRGVAAMPTLIPEPSVPGDATLNVNVFRPSVTSDELRPVLVWIHGGGFVSGSPASPWYDGEAFNRDGVVSVVVSYRLGFEGFGWIEDAPVNRAVLDWVAALQWVQRCISAFGGDPARVTIAGQSAGGTAVLTLMGMESARGLFSGAIALSPAAFHCPASRAQATGRRMAELAGVPATVAGWRTIPETVVMELQEQLLAPGDSDDAAQTTADFITDGMGWGPWIDGDLIQVPSLSAATSDAALDVPLVIGSTDDEFTQVFAADPGVVGVAPAEVLRRIGVSPAAASTYLASRDDAAPEVIGQIATDLIFRAPAHDVAARRSERGSVTWLYRFAWPSGSVGSAVHCVDVPFFFDLLDREDVTALLGDAPPHDLARHVHGAAAMFIVSRAASWPAYTPDEPSVMIFDVPSRVVRDSGEALRGLLSSDPEARHISG
ncbi:carboxylesterase/lipase family protein [Aeromicrobium fastidiosum]|uniref:carboxylesterase/lipase family protein n=1 Tax=Aeromicrobium fastidiosum TaxID=52699 RepID=UPI00165F874F|nr:carboxylesterase family protein [Aeromicrobium fastidiosum]MBP2390206.1 para-nitrobenzyl esterase [Aeromicrobium fastidiosum]